MLRFKTERFKILRNIYLVNNVNFYQRSSEIFLILFTVTNLETMFWRNSVKKLLNAIFKFSIIFQKGQIKILVTNCTIFYQSNENIAIAIKYLQYFLRHCWNILYCVGDFYNSRPRLIKISRPNLVN